jgi:hypothetical protein
MVKWKDKKYSQYNIPYINKYIYIYAQQKAIRQIQSVADPGPI